MADFKANMLITIASVVLTLAARYVVTPAMVEWPAVVLMMFCLLTIILAAYAVMPKLAFPLGLGRNRSHKPNDSAFNILFFGDFTQMNQFEYENAMQDILNDHSRHYEAQVREIYQIGLFLAKKKYRYLHWAYLSFISGFVISGLTLLFTRLFW